MRRLFGWSSVKTTTSLVPFQQPRSWPIQSLLRPKIPEASQRMPIDPRRSLSPAARVQKSVADLPQNKLAAAKPRALSAIAVLLRKPYLRQIVHRQRKGLPTAQFLPHQRHCAIAALPFGPQFIGERLSAQQRAPRPKLSQLREFFLRFTRTEIDHRVNLRQRSGLQFVASIRGIEQRFAQARASERGKNALHVILVVSKRPVFVLAVHGNHG